MSLGNNIRRGALWLFIGNTGNQILGFLLGIILARILVPEDFGMILTIQIFTGLVGMVSGGGMGQALVRAKDVCRADYDVVFALQLLIGCAIYLAFFAVAPYFAQWYDNTLYADLLRVSALSFVIRPLVNLPVNLLHRDMRFKATALIQLFNLVLSNSISISMALLGFGVWSLTVSGIITSILSIPLLFHITRWHPRLNTDWRRAQELARYGALVSANDIVVYLRQQISSFVISRTAGAGSVGLYNKADSLAFLPQRFITSSVYNVLFRALAIEQDNLDRCRYLYFRSVTLVALYSLPIYVGMALLAEPLVVTLYGEKWRSAAAPIAVLTFASPLLIIGTLSGAVLAAHNKLAKELVVQLVLLAITAAAILTALPYGLVGVAAGIVFASVYNAAHMYILASRVLKTTWKQLARALTAPLLLSGILAGFLLALRQMLPSSLIANSLLYLLTMASLGGLVYGACFLFIPLASLKSESDRWKEKLKISHRAS